MHDPSDRTWGFAARTAIDISTDKIDGYLARYAGKTRFGGFLDQISDKVWYLTIVDQLVRNREILPIHRNIALAQSIGSNVLRAAALHYGIDTDAKELGQWKFTLQAGAVLSACSPLAAEQPEFVEFMFDAASGLTAISGIEQAVRFSREFVSPLLAEAA